MLEVIEPVTGAFTCTHGLAGVHNVSIPMKAFIYVSCLGLAAAGTSFGQSCDVVNDDFNAAPVSATLDVLPGWSVGFTSPPTIGLAGGGVNQRNAQINTFGFGGTSTGTRTFDTSSAPGGSTGFYTISVEIEASGGDTAFFSLDCTQGIASQVFYSGGVVSSIFGPAVTVPGGVVTVQYRVTEATGYELLVNGMLLETGTWPTVGCGAQPSVSIGANLSFGGGIVTFDNLCIETTDAFNIGTNYCQAVANSTGGIADIVVSGDPTVANNNVQLRLSNMPPNSFGFFIVGQGSGFVMNPGGSSGNLCLNGSPIGRYVGPGEVMNGGPQGEIVLPIDLSQTPTPTGFMAINAGETWNFQAWYRDIGPTTNFSEGCSVVFQ